MDNQAIPKWEDTTEYIPKFEETEPYNETAVPKFQRMKNLQPLFSGSDKIESAFSPLEQLKVKKLMSDYDNPDETKMKLANVMFFANRQNMEPDAVFRNYDSLAKEYFGKPVSTQEAYNKIAERVNGSEIVDTAKSIWGGVLKPVAGFARFPSWLKDFTYDMQASRGNFYRENDIQPVPQNPMYDMPDMGQMFSDLRKRDVKSGKITEKEFLEKNPALPSSAKINKENKDMGLSDPVAEWADNQNAEADRLLKEATDGRGVFDEISKGNYSAASNVLVKNLFFQTPQLAMQFGGTMVNPALGLGLMGAQTAGNQYSDVADDENMSQEGKHLNVFATAVSGIATESWTSLPLMKGAGDALKNITGYSLSKVKGMPIFLKGLPAGIAEAADKLAGTATRKEILAGVKNGTKEMAKGFFIEGTGEALDQFDNNLTDLITNKDGKNLSNSTFGDLFNGVPDSFLIGGPFGSLFKGIEHSQTLSKRINRMNQINSVRDNMTPAERDLLDSKIMADADTKLQELENKSVLTPEETEQKNFLSKNIDDPDAIFQRQVQEYVAAEDNHMQEVDTPVRYAAENITKEEISDFIDEVPEVTNAEKGYQNKATYELGEKTDINIFVDNVKKLSDDFLQHTQENPINSTFGHKIYFEPDKKSIERLGPRKAFIEYVLHVFTGTKPDKDVNTREMRNNKLKEAGLIMDTARNPEAYSIEADKVYYYRKTQGNKYSVLVLRNEKGGLVIDELRFITHLPQKSKTYIDKISGVQPDNPISDGDLTRQTNGDSVPVITDIINQNPEKVKPVNDELKKHAEKALEVLKKKKQSAPSDSPMSGGLLTEQTNGDSISGIEDSIAHLKTLFNREITVVENQQGLAELMKVDGHSDAEISDMLTRKVLGAWVPGKDGKNKIVIVAGNLKSGEKEAVKTVLHEIIGHEGLRGVFKGKDFDSLMDMFADYYGIDKKQENWQVKAEEAFAKDCESFDPAKSMPGKFRQLWTQFKLMLARFLPVNLSDKDIASIMAASFKYAKGKENASGVRYRESSDIESTTENETVSLSSEDMVSYAVVGAGKMVDGHFTTAKFNAEMIKEFGTGIEAALPDIYQKSLEIYSRTLLEAPNGNKNSRNYFDGFKQLFNDPDYKNNPDAMQWDSRFTRLIKNADKDTLYDSLKLIESKLENATPDLAGELNGMQHRVASQINKLQGVEKKARKKTEKAEQKQQKEQAQENKNSDAEKISNQVNRDHAFDEWKRVSYPLIWTIESDFGGAVKPSSRFAGQEDWLNGSYIDWKNGHESDVVANALGMEEEELLNQITGITKKQLREEYSYESKAMDDEHTKHQMNQEEGVDGESLSNLTQGIIADIRRKAFKEGYGQGRNELKNTYDELVATLRSDKHDLVKKQNALKDFAFKYLPAGYRDKIFKKIIELGSASIKATDKNPEGRRQAIFNSIINDIPREAMIKKIQEFFDGSRVKKDSRGKPIGKLTAEIHAKLDELRAISELKPYAVEKMKEEIGERLNNPELEEEEKTELAEKMADLQVFGNLNSKTPAELTESLDNLLALVKTGRTLMKQKLEKYMSDLLYDRSRMQDEITGGKALLSKEDEIIDGFLRNKNVMAEGLRKFHRRNLPFEWLLNNITRKSKNGQLQGKIKELSTAVHKSTNQEESGTRIRFSRFEKAVKDIFGLKGNLGMYRAMKELRQDKAKDTGVFAFRGREYDWKNVTLKDAKEMLQEYDNGTDKTMTRYQAEAVRQQINDMEAGDKKAVVKYQFNDGVTDEIVKSIAAENQQGLVSIPIMKKEGKKVEQPLTQGIALQYLLCWKQPNVRYKMEFNGWHEDSIKQLEKFLKPETKKLGEWMVADLKKDYPALNDVFKETYYVNLPSGENYFPTRYETGSKRSDAMMLDGKAGMSSLNPGSFISRRFHMMEPKAVDALSLYVENVVQMEHFKAWSGTMKKLRGIFQAKDIKKAVVQNCGEDAYHVLIEKLDHFADGGNKKAQSVAWLDKLRTNFVIGALAANTSVFVKQLTAYPAFMFDIPMKDFAYYQLEFFKNPVENAKMLLETEYFKNRWGGGFDRDMIAFLERSQNLSGDNMNLAKDIAESLMIVGRLGDALPTIAGGYSVYKYHYDRLIKSGMAEKEAKAEALTEWEMSVDRSQQAGHVKDLGIYQSGGSLARLFTMFTTSPRLYYAHLAESFGDAMANRKGAKQAFTRKVFIAHVVLPLAFQLACDVMRKGAERDEYEIKDYLLACLLGPYEGLFLVGKAFKYSTDYAVNWMFSEKDTFKHSQIDNVPILSDVERGFAALGKIANDFSFENIIETADDLTRSAAPFNRTAAVVNSGVRETNRGAKILKWLGIINE